MGGITVKRLVGSSLYKSIVDEILPPKDMTVLFPIISRRLHHNVLFNKLDDVCLPDLQALLVDDEERATAPPKIGEQSQLTKSDVVHNSHLCVDVHLEARIF